MDGDLETDIDEVDDQDLEVVLSSPVMKDIAPVVMVTNLDIIFKQTQERFHYTFNEQGPSEINTQSARHGAYTESVLSNGVEPRNFY